MKNKWVDNNIQFPRLLAEIKMVVTLTPKQKKQLCQSMELEFEKIEEIFDRALTEFNGAKRRVFK